MSEEIKEVNQESIVNNEIKNDPEIGILKKDIKHREQLKEALTENEKLKIASERERKELSEKIESSNSTANQFKEKYAFAELKAQAIAAGLKDIDCVKMMDTSSVTVDENGNVKGVEEIISSFKNAKPHFFGEDKKTSSSTNAATPVGSVAKQVNAMNFTNEEWEIECQRALQNPAMFNNY